MAGTANYAERAVLKNGTTVLTRAIRGDDKGRISGASRNLEINSVYTRFLHYKKALTDKELKAAKEVDFESVVASVITTGEGGDETIIGGVGDM